MTVRKKRFRNAQDVLAGRQPIDPVYCVYPHVYAATAQRFLRGFPGRVLYAVKANNDAAVVRTLYDAGIRHFDCASLAEIELVATQCAEPVIYYMNPVRLPGAAATAQRKFGVRHFVTDHGNGLSMLLNEIDATACVIFARMAVSHASAMQDLSAKFGARPEQIPDLVEAIRSSGAEAALAFNVGTGVTDPAAYSHALTVAREVLNRLPQAIRLLDIGGGFPVSYPNYAVPEIEAFFAKMQAAIGQLSLAPHGELLAEPGRALSAPGLSAIVRVLLVKSDRIYLNDGMYGAFWELRFDGQSEYPFRVFRDARPLHGAAKNFRIYGPTCDGSDKLPTAIDLPQDIRAGDYIEFGSIGAYSLSGRTNFNGFYSDDVVTITDPGARPPVLPG